MFSLLYSFIQRSLNSALVQILVPRVGDLQWLESLTMNSAENKALTPFVGQPYRQNNSSHHQHIFWVNYDETFKNATIMGSSVNPYE